MTCCDIAPCAQATRAAQSTRTVAASDGVARPPYIEPSTQAIRNSAGARSFRAVKRSLHGTCESLASVSGTMLGLRLVCSITQTMKVAASRNPGSTPAVNSFRIETSPSTP
jgi:hypothetical protein